MFEITLHRAEKSITVKMSGELTYTMIEMCMPIMTEVKSISTDKYIVDVSRLDSIDSSGLGVLVSIRNAATKHQKKLHISGAHGQVAEILKMTRFDVLAVLE